MYQQMWFYNYRLRTIFAAYPGTQMNQTEGIDGKFVYTVYNTWKEEQITISLSGSVELEHSSLFWFFTHTSIYDSITVTFTNSSSRKLC